jgi:hypothetical protein
MSRSRSEISIFSTSFLDLLSCGMGAVIILLIIFISQLQVDSKDATPFAVVAIKVDNADCGPDSFQESLFVGKQAVTRPAGPTNVEYFKGNTWEKASLTDNFSTEITAGGTFDGADLAVAYNESLVITPPVADVYFRADDGTKVDAKLGFAPIRLPAKWCRRTYNLTIRNLASKTQLKFSVQRRQFPAGQVPAYVAADGEWVPLFDIERLFLGKGKLQLLRRSAGKPAAAWDMAFSRDSSNWLFSYPRRIEIAIHASTSPIGANAAAALRPTSWVFPQAPATTFAMHQEIELTVTLDENLELNDPVSFVAN